MTFLEWYNEADMPVRQSDGTWVDLETGIAFNPSEEKVRAERKSLSIKAQDARAVAKSFGGKALTGTAKQKEWAEKIRAEKLNQMDFESATLVCDKLGLLNNSKFWIEKRNISAKDIAEFITKQKALLAQYRKLKPDSDEAHAIADEYNALTKKWGLSA